MVSLTSAQWRSGPVVKLSGVLITSDGYAVDESRGNERWVYRGRVCNWSEVTTEDGRGWKVKRKLHGG